MAPLHQFFFYVTLVLLPTQLGLHMWPQWALVLGRRVDYLSPTLYLTDITVLLTIIFWFLAEKSLISDLKFFIKQKKFFLLVCFIFLNIWFAASRPVTLFHWLKVLEFVLFGYYIVCTKPPVKRVVFFLSIAVGYSSILTFVQFFLQHSLDGILWFLGERTFTSQTPGVAQINWCIPAPCRLLLRPYATFPHPNVLGGFLALTLPLITGSWPVFLLGFLALVLTFSRSAWFGFALIMTFALRKKSKIFLIISLFILALLFINGIHLTDESIVIRGQLNTAAITMWQRSPIVGVGLGNFLVKLPQALPSRTIYFLQPVHNIYLLMLSETGILGLGIFLFLLFHVFKKLQTSLLEFQIIAILLIGFVDHYFFTLQQGQILLTLFLAASMIHLTKISQ